MDHWGTRPRKNSEIHIDVSHSRQPLVKGERLVRYEVNTVMPRLGCHGIPSFEVHNHHPSAFNPRHPHLDVTCSRTLVAAATCHHAYHRALQQAVAPVCRQLVVSSATMLAKLLTQRSSGVLLLAKCQARATRKSV